MPLIYLPDQAVQYIRQNKLPTNQLYELTDLIQKKLMIKAQENLARFKLDI